MSKILQSVMFVGAVFAAGVFANDDDQTPPHTPPEQIIKAGTCECPPLEPKR